MRSRFSYRCYVGKGAYLRDPWNVLDFVILIFMALSLGISGAVLIAFLCLWMGAQWVLYCVHMP